MTNFVEKNYKLNIDALGNFVDDFSEVRWMRNETFDRFHDAVDFIKAQLSEMDFDDIQASRECHDGFTPVFGYFQGHPCIPVWIERKEDVYNEYEY